MAHHGYLLSLADELLHLHLLNFEVLTLQKGTVAVVAEELSRLKKDVSFVQALLRQEALLWVQSHDFERLLLSLETPLARIMNLVVEMQVVVGCRKRDKIMSSPKKVLTFFSFSSLSSSPFHFNHDYKLDLFKAVTATVHEIVIKIRNHETFHKLHETQYLDHCKEEDIIGRNDDKTEIIKLVLDDDDDDDFRVILVMGVPGIGKTTLARIVYNDDQIQEKFELYRWVFMGDDANCNSTKIVMRLVEGEGVPTYNCNPPMDRLQKELRRAISGKRCLIVMDDMVDENPLNWVGLKDMLKGCAKGTCVLITTCSEKVYDLIRRTGSGSVKSYSLDCLSEEDSWVVFKRQALLDKDEKDLGELEVIGREIVAKCEGVPLSLRVISLILRYDVYNLLPWVKFNDVEMINEEVKRYKGLVFPNAQEIRVANSGWRQTQSFVPQDMVVGRDEEKQEIIAELLKKNHEKVMVIPIVGSGGLGKTTLAQLIFNDKKIECHFDLKIWVCVTDAFDVKAIVERITQSITSNYFEELGFEQSVILLRQEIREKRYLLVLDDLWNEDEIKWNELIYLLSDGAYGSRIIVTTHSKRVAEITGMKHQHELQILDEEKSWLLFLKVAFVQREHPTDPEIIKIGKAIVKKCGGVPLIIRTIGSIMFSKDPETEWQSFYDEELSKVIEKESDVLATLHLSYDHLPTPLKKCFGYCALFPKDYEFDVDTLISLWMSQGFIEWRQDVEKLGYEYFMDLLRRSFFQETKKDELGNIKQCKLQNLMHDLARKVAENDCATLGLKEDKFDSKHHHLRHVSFDFHLDSSWQIPISLAKSKQIQSLILPRQFRWEIEGRSSESICDVILKLKWLRMLDLHNSGIKVLPNSIGELKNLHYLDLSQNVNIKLLPSSICMLRKLQTLKLNHCSNLQSLPRSITKLRRLRNLENESCYSLTNMPHGLHQLFQLRRLSEFVLLSNGISSSSISKKSGKLDELGALNDLGGKLKIKNLRFPKDDKTAKANLYEKEDLLSLILIWDINSSINENDCEEALEDLEPHQNLRELSISAYGGSKFPNWLPLLQKLVKLSLSRCNRCHCLPPLNRLPNLQVLVLDELMELEYIVDESTTTTTSSSFSTLKELRLTNLPKLKEWWKNAEELVLKNTCWGPFNQTMAAAKEEKTSEFQASSSTTTFTVVPLSKLKTLHIIAMDMSTGDPNIWQSLPSLRSVTLDHIADIHNQLQKLQKVTNLQQLHIWRCDSLKEIPSWISNVKSLKTISIKLCPELTIPRERLSLIASLKKVEIEDCPQVSHIESMLKDPLYN
ncbi:disease resistance protein RGA2 isoform X2 [Cannabis sativa]|uniref:disease resistance protein RGA2 isoform X2 n=1 Tax=Cannabis sativa TaxID=3483 RepID=UPI0029CA4B78|nr:disease resistance protein RGA2 isoform X2 [Cannabis sativa]